MVVRCGSAVRVAPALVGFALVGFALVAALAGCSGADEARPAPPVPGPLSSPAPSALPPARDGDDLAACTDGDCEVRIGGPVAIPLDPRFGVTGLRVESVGGNVVTFSVDFSGGRVESSGCRSSFTGPSAGAPARARAGCPTSGRLSLERISLGVAATRADSAVIRVLAR